MCENIPTRTIKEYYQDNKEQIIENVKIYREENKEQIAEYNRKYIEQNKEQINSKKGNIVSR
jgi:hypothetical protein